jgi:4-hydroxy-3-methylbut-2-enyl diphosphate reductase
MEIVRATTAGFCMGVVMALQKLEALVKEASGETRIFTLGPIIHNPQVLDEYARKGVSRTESPDDVPPGATAVIRAHGVPRFVEEGLRARGVDVVDATCPKVKKAQLLIGEEAGAGRFVLLYGEESHPEVKGLLSYARSGSFVFDSKEKLDSFPLLPGGRYCLAAQTTQDRDEFGAIASSLAGRDDLDIKILNTICDATKRRQEETVRIAMNVDFMIVIGGLDSGNTRRLAQVVSAQRKPCLHVESPGDIPMDRVRQFPKVGLTAGASTPKKLIDEVHLLLKTG